MYQDSRPSGLDSHDGFPNSALSGQTASITNLPDGHHRFMQLTKHTSCLGKEDV